MIPLVKRTPVRLPPIFERDYRALLERIKGQAQVVMMTPFFLSVPGGAKKLSADLDEKIEVVTRLAETYADVFINLHQYVTEIGNQIDPALLLPDGVHPSQMGHGFIADHWRKAMGAQLVALTTQGFYVVSAIRWCS